MRLPSAYCATSSGIAMETRRVSTQPDWPPEARMRLQPSTRGASFRGGSCAASAANSSRSVLESSTQSAGSAGGLGMGGGGTWGAFLASFLARALGFLGEGGSNDLRGASERVRTMDRSTSNLSFSLSCRKLGEESTGWVNIERRVGGGDALGW